MSRMNRILALALCAPPALAATGGVVVFQGTGGSLGDVRVVDPAGVLPPVSPAGLQGIVLLDLEVNGRTRLERFLPGKAWRQSDVDGAARIVLPDRQGSLYHHERPSGVGSSTFGFFVVDEKGDVRVVIEHPGTGPAGDVDPFEARAAIAPDGRAALVATTLAAGGNLFELDLESGASTQRSAGLPPLAFQLRGLALADTLGVAVTTTGVLRFDRATPGDAQAVDLGSPTPAWYQGDVVLSANGLHAATAAGSGPPPLAHVYVFSLTGPALRVSETERAVTGAGFLPESEHGPFLAVSDDGSTAAWRAVIAGKREAFLARTSPPSGQAPQQVSADAYYSDTLDEIGQYGFRPGSTSAILAVGSLSANAPFTIEGADYFEVALDASGAPQFTNLSLSSGAAQPPYPATSHLDPVLASWTPDRSAIVFHDDEGERLLAARPGQVGLQVVLDQVKDLDRVEALGPDLVATTRSSSGNKDKGLFVIPAGTLTPGPAFFTAPDAHEFPTALPRVGGKFAFVEELPTHELLRVYDHATGQTTLLTPRPLRYGRSVGLGPNGEFTFTVGLPGSPAVFAKWPFPAGPKRLITPVVPGFVLPGA